MNLSFKRDLYTRSLLIDEQTVRETTCQYNLLKGSNEIREFSFSMNRRNDYSKPFSNVVLLLPHNLFSHPYRLMPH